MTRNTQYRRRPIGRGGTHSKPGFCSLPAKPPHFGHPFQRKIRHTPRYCVALCQWPESTGNPPFYAAYARLEYRGGAYTVIGMLLYPDARQRRPRLEWRISAKSAPRSTGS